MDHNKRVKELLNLAKSLKKDSSQNLSAQSRQKRQGGFSTFNNQWETKFFKTKPTTKKTKFIIKLLAYTILLYVLLLILGIMINFSTKEAIFAYLVTAFLVGCLVSYDSPGQYRKKFLIGFFTSALLYMIFAYLIDMIFQSQIIV